MKQLSCSERRGEIMNPLISIIIPVYNIDLYLEKCIESVIHQTYRNLEIILVDDGSTDSSSVICDSYKEKDNRIIVLHKKNGGLVSARKAGMNVAKGEYIVNVDGDDYIDERFIEVLITSAIKNNADVVESGYLTCKAHKQLENRVLAAEYNCAKVEVRDSIISDWLYNPSCAKIHSTIWSKLYKAKLFKMAYSNVPDDMQFGEDWISFIYLISNVEKILVLDVCLYYYLERADSLSHNAVRKVTWYIDALYLYTKVIKMIGSLFPSISKSDLNYFFVSQTSHFINFSSNQPNYIFPQINSIMGKQILLYGAGKVGQSFYKQFSLYNKKLDVVAWVDKKAENCFFDYAEVKTISEGLALDFDIILIAVLKENVFNEIKKELVNLDVPTEKIVWQKPVSDNQIPSFDDVGYNIVQIIGGLGNQMFQYAFYRALKEKFPMTKVNIDSFVSYKRPFELKKVFPNVKLEYDSEKGFDKYKNPLSPHELYYENGASHFDISALTKQDSSFIGYWQTEKYFKNIETELRNELRFNVKDKDLFEVAKRIQDDNSSVSLHVRRGDYMEMPELYCGICTVEYYRKAVQHISNHVSNPKFYVFSDDLEWVKENIYIPNVVYVSKDMFSSYDNWYDMYLMSCCKHNIIANSSFSWWGAWLNNNSDKIVIAPKIWQNGVETPDIWCDDWVKL